MSKPTNHQFRGVTYRIKWRRPKGYPENVWGACDPPTKKNPMIEISPMAEGPVKLCVLVDEAIHACLFDLDNDSVDECSEAIGHFLWKCGLRFMEDGQD